MVGTIVYEEWGYQEVIECEDEQTGARVIECLCDEKPVLYRVEWPDGYGSYYHSSYKRLHQAVAEWEYHAGLVR